MEGSHTLDAQTPRDGGAHPMSKLQEKLKRAMKGLETSTQRAREAAREARDEALETWNENIRPGLEPLEAETRARATAVGNELIDAVEAARSKLRDALDNDA